MLKMLKKLSRRDGGYALICIAFIAAQVWLDMTMPEYMSRITVLIEALGSAMSEIWRVGGIMLLCALGSLTTLCITAVFPRRSAAIWRVRCVDVSSSRCKPSP